MRQARLNLSVAACIFLFAPLWAGAQGGPPLLTDDPITPGDRHWEVNIALTAEHFRGERSYGAPLLDLNYGLGERIQLKWEVPWLMVQTPGAGTRSGLGDSKLGVKWRF